MAKRKPKRQRRERGTGYIRPTPAGRFKAHFPKEGGGYHVRTFATEPEAAGWLEELSRQQAEHYDVGGGRQTLRAWAQAWLDLRGAEDPPLKAKTLSDYTFKLGYIVDLLGDVALADLLPDHVDQAMLKVNRALSATTAAQIRNLLRQVLAEALRRRYISFNPAEAPKRRRAPARKTVKRLSVEQARRLLAAARGRDEELAWWLLLTLGLRAGEVLGLRRQDIDPARATLTINQQATVLNGRIHIDTPKTRSSVRTLPIPAGLLPALRLLCARLEDSDRLFPIAISTLMHMLRHRRGPGPGQVSGLALTADLPEHLTIHGLRHTAGQFYADAGMSEHYIAALFGHAPSTVTRHYAPPSVEALRPWVEQVYALLAGDASVVRLAG